MDYLKKLARFVLPYKRFAVLTILSNIFFALFSTLSMVALSPMINVLFDEARRVTAEPVYSGIGSLKIFIKDSLGYFITSVKDTHGPQRALLYMIVLIIVLFLLKNVFSYLGVFFAT